MSSAARRFVESRELEQIDPLGQLVPSDLAEPGRPRRACIGRDPGRSRSGDGGDLRVDFDVAATWSFHSGSCGMGMRVRPVEANPAGLGLEVRHLPP